MTVTNGKLFGKWASQGGPEGGRARAGTNDLVRGRAHAHHIAIVTARRHLREVRTIPQTVLARWRRGLRSMMHVLPSLGVAGVDSSSLVALLTVI